MKHYIDNLIETKLKNNEDLIIKEGDYHSSNNNLKGFKVLSMKAKINSNEYLGISIKEISQTAIELTNLAIQKATNVHICTFSHEFRTPINQALGILSNLKSESKDRSIKDNLGMAKSAILKLFLKLEEFLNYAKMNNGTFIISSTKTSISKIFKEIKKMNYEYFCSLGGKKIILRTDSKVQNSKIFLDARLTIMIIQFLLEKLQKNSNNYDIEVQAILSTKERNIEFVISEKDKNDRKQKMQLGFLRGASINSSSMPLFPTVSYVEAVSEFSQVYVDKICGLMNTKIDFRKEKGEYIVNSFKLNNYTRNDDDSLMFSDDDFRENELDIKNINKNFLNFSRMISIRKKADLDLYSEPSPKKINKISLKPIIFVVDDEILNRYAIQGMLKSLNIKIVEAENGLICLHRYKELNIEEKEKLLIFLDLSMPQMDGIACCSEIRKLEVEGNLGRSPIIALTGHDSNQEREKALQAGFTEFCTKPISKEKLFELVAKYLSLK